MISLPTSAEENTDLSKIHIDRDTEVKKALDAIVKQKHNVLVHGEKGVGKTHLAKIIYSILTKNANVFASFISVPELRSYYPSEPNKAFPRAVLLHLCIDIWKTIFKKDILDMQSKKTMLGKFKVFENRRKRKLREIYRFLMSDQVFDQYSFSSSGGIKQIAEASLSESAAISSTKAGVLPFEFSEYAEILANDIVSHYNKDRIIVFFDNANNMPSNDQQEILEVYLSLFLERNIQIVFIGGKLPWESFSFVSDGFQTQIKLLGFSDCELTRKFIDKMMPEGYTLRIRLYDELHYHYSGHPRKIQNCLIKALVYCEKYSVSKISNKIMKMAIEETDFEYKVMDDIFKREGHTK